MEIKIDKQGRIIIPAEYRKKMNISPETKLKIYMVYNQLIIEKQSQIDEEKLTIWKKKIQSLNLKIHRNGSDIVGEKWMSEDYVRNKLGL